MLFNKNDPQMYKFALIVQVGSSSIAQSVGMIVFYVCAGHMQ